MADYKSRAANPFTQGNKFYQLLGQVVVQAVVATLLSDELGIRKPVRIAENVEYKVVGNGIEVYMPSYYKFIESGRRAGATPPPYSVILQWIKDKNIQPNTGISINKLAWAIRGAIAKRGIKPKPFVQKAFNNGVEEVSIIIFGEVDSYLTDVIRLITVTPR